MRVIVTGANGGLGYEATKAFAHSGATIVIACRSVDRGEQAAQHIRETTDSTGATLDVRECGLASLSSVAEFATGVGEDYDELSVLCNNAGVAAIPRNETEDGFETQLGANHPGHFALAGHLLDLLVGTPGETRIVTHSSTAHTSGSIDFEDLHREDSYSRWEAYGRSKLSNLLFAHELQRRLEEAGYIDTLSVACHPGHTDTDLQYRGPEEMGSTLRYGLMRVANAVFAQPAEQGVLPLLYAATAPDVEGGTYYGPGGFINIRGSPERQESNEASHDKADAARLWDVSEELTGVECDVETTQTVKTPQ